jgi:hypothetical protein
MRKQLQIFIAGNVITVGVCVGYDQGNALAAVLAQPVVNLTLYDVGDVGLPRAGVQKKRLLLAKKQVEERLLVIRAPRLTQNMKILIVFMDLKLRVGRALWAADLPASR